MRCVSLESRHAREMVRMLERHGAEALSAPSMQEVPLADQNEAHAFGDVLLAGGCDVLVLLTGVGTRMLVQALSETHDRSRVLAALASTELACRGPKPVAALKELGLAPALVAPEPNTWRELLGALDGHGSLAGRRVFVQEYGLENAELTAALASRGAHVHRVPVYGWRLPDDTGPLEVAIVRLCAGEADAVLFTSGRQIDHLLEVAARMGRRDELARVLVSDVLLVSIGPVTSEALRAHGLEADLSPARPKMGPMVKAVVERGPGLLAAKRSRA
jgi:uroporphyrinogen-III synthase